jgi:hypothetical protein
MVDFARLVLAADTSQMKTAAGDIDRVAKAGEGAEKSADGMSAGMKRAAVAAAALGVAAAAAAASMVFRGAIREAEALENRMLQMNAIITATGGAAQRSADQLLEQARAMNRATLQSTEGIMQAQQTMLTFRNVQGEVFDSAIKSAADMAAALGGDLNSAALQLGKALEDPINSLSALGRNGAVSRSFIEANEERIKSMVESGNIASAQAIILAELSNMYGGAAEAGSRLAFAQDSLAQTVQESLIALNDSLGLTDKLAAAYEAMERALVFATENISRAMDILVVSIAGLAATQIPAAVLALKVFAGGMTAATIATGIFTGAVNLARGAVIALGGPLGIVWGLIGAAGAAWLVFRDNTDPAAAAMDDAKAASDALNAALGTFYSTAAPSAGKAAIELANDNYKLAASAVDAAKAELAKARALIDSARAEQRPGRSGSTQAARLAAQRAEAAALGQIAAAEAALEKATRDRRAAVVAVTGSMSEAMTANKELEVSITATTTAMDQFGGGAGSSGGGSAQAAADALTDTGKAADDLAETLSGPLTSAVDGVANAFADFMMRGFRDFKSFAAGIVNSFKRMLTEMIATAARNRIMLSIGMGGSVAGTAASAAGSMMGGAAAGVGAVGSTVGAVGLGTAAMHGASLAASGFMTGGMSGMATAIGAQVGAATAAGASAAAMTAAVAAVAAPLLAVYAAFKFFQKTTKTLDSGLRATIDGTDVLVETFKKTQTSRFFGLSKSTSTSFSGASDGIAGPIQQAYADIRTSVLGMAGALGIGNDALDNFSAQIMISTRKMSDDQAQAAILGAFEKLTDEMAETILRAGVRQAAAAELALFDGAEKSRLKMKLTVQSMFGGFSHLQKEGEGAAATLQRLSSSLTAVNQAMRFLARDLFDVSIAGADMASSLVDLLGGLDGFTQAHQSYFENFYSEQERISLRFAELTRNFETLGLEAEGLAISLPETNAAFRALVEAQDLTTEAGRGAYAALLLLSSEFASLQDATGSLKGAMSGLSDAMAAEVRGLQRQLLQLQGNIAAVRDMTLADLQSDEARAIQREIFALEDEKAKSSEKVARATRSATSASNGLTDAMKKAEEVSKEREKLERAILGLEGNVIELRRRELTEVDASNRALQSRIWLLEDEAKVTSEREGLERRLLELQGNVAELRRRELDGLDATNQGLQLAIWKLEDFNSALRGLNQNDFATLVDFNRAAALEANRLQSTMTGMGSVEGVIFESGEAFTAASSGLTAALGSMVTATENLTDQMADFAVSIRAMVRAPANDDMIIKGVRFLQRPQAFQPVQWGGIRGEVIELKEYVRELVKINHKQERTLKEIQLQGETA